MVFNTRENGVSIPERLFFIAVDLTNPESIILNSRLFVPGLSMCVHQIDIAPTTCDQRGIGVLCRIITASIAEQSAPAAKFSGQTSLKSS